MVPITVTMISPKEPIFVDFFVTRSHYVTLIDLELSM